MPVGGAADDPVTVATTADPRRRALVLLVVLTLVWGTNWPLFPLVMREISVWTFRSISLTCAGLLLLAVARARGQSLAVPRRHWPVLVAASLLYLVVWNVAAAYSAVLIPSGQSAVLGFTMPLWAALVSWGVLGERLSARQWLAVALAALGVALLVHAGLGGGRPAALGLGLGLAGAIGWAIGTLVLKRGRVEVPATVSTGWQMLIASLPITAAAIVLGDGPWFWPSTTTLVVLAYITVVPMGVGNVAWFSIVGLLPANVAGLSSIMVPVVAMLSGAVVHGEPLGPAQLAAMACCAAALWLALGSPASRG